MRVAPSTIRLVLPEPAVARSRGVHVSGIIRSIATEMGILKREFAEEVGLVDVRTITDPSHLLRIMIGLAFEEWYIPHILSQYGVSKHPGEMCVDGVYMTPDGESVDVIITHPRPYKIPGLSREETALRIHEVKATYKSTNTVGDLSKEWMWLTQMRAYCKGAGTRYAKLHVLFLCGDYKMPLQPQLKVWDIEFTQQEIDSNWDLLKEYKEYREKHK